MIDEGILKSKEAHRKKLRELPFEGKLIILNQLRLRALMLKEAKLNKGNIK